MNDEERSDSEHRSVLAGMTTAEARALAERAFRYAAGNPALTIDEVQKACALAALGAEVVGAKDMWAPLSLVHANSRVITDNGSPAIRVLVLEGK